MKKNLAAQQIVDALNVMSELWSETCNDNVFDNAGFEMVADVLLDRLHEMGVEPEQTGDGRLCIMD